MIDRFGYFYCGIEVCVLRVVLFCVSLLFIIYIERLGEFMRLSSIDFGGKYFISN